MRSLRPTPAWTLLVLLLCAAAAAPSAQQGGEDGRIDAHKREVASNVDGMAKMAQEMVDSVFSFSELAHQEFETSRYLTGVLERNGFSVRRGCRNADRRGWRPGARENLLSPSGRISTAFRRLRRSRAFHTVIR